MDVKKEIWAILQRNDERFALRVLAFIMSLEKTLHK